MINIKLAVPSDQDSWDNFVQSHPDATPYHMFAWKLAVEQAYGHKTFYFIAQDSNDNRILGVLPLVLIQIPLLKSALHSLPFCDLGGVLSTSEEAKSLLIEQAQKLSEQQGHKKLDLRCSLPNKNKSALTKEEETEFKGKKVRMLLDLPESSEELMASFKSKLRSQIRKAEKNGISYYQSTGTTDLDAFYLVMQANMRMLGSPVHSRKWFESVLVNYKENAQIGIVKKDDEVVGGAIIIKCGNTITVPWASTLAEYNKLSPNMLLYWGLLSYAADQEGTNTFDFGRSSVNEGTYKFKKQWGAEPLALDWQSFKGRELEAPSTTAPSDGKSQLRDKIAATWAKLPLPIVNTLGPILRRYISL